MSYNLLIEIVDGQPRVTSTSGTVPEKVTVAGHVPDGSAISGGARPNRYLSVSDGVITASSSAPA